MGLRGPPPTPTSLTLLRGNPGKRPIPKDEPKPPPVTEAPPAPAWLHEHGRREWERVAPILVNTRVLTQVDLPALEDYCRQYEKALKHDAFLDENGETYEYALGEGAARRVMYRARPEVAMARDAWRDMRAAAAQLGLSPASRTRVRGTSALDDKTTPDDNARFFEPRR